MVNSPAANSTAPGIKLEQGWTNASLTGNVVFGFGLGSSNSVAFVSFPGAAVSYTITNPGSGYTDSSAIFTGTKSYTTYALAHGITGAAPNYIVATGVTAPTGAGGGTTSCAFTDHLGLHSSLPASQGGIYTCYNLSAWRKSTSNCTVAIAGSNCNSACVSSESGTIWLPYYNVPITCTGVGSSGCANTTAATGAQVGIISSGGAIVYVGTGGADATNTAGNSGRAFVEQGGANYTNGDTVTDITGSTL